MSRLSHTIVLIVLLTLALVGCGGLETPVISAPDPCVVEPGGSMSLRLSSSGYPSRATFKWSTTYGRVEPDSTTSTRLMVPLDASAGEPFTVILTLTNGNRSVDGTVDCWVAGESLAEEPPDSTSDSNDGEGQAAAPTPRSSSASGDSAGPLADSEVWFNSHPSNAAVYVVPAAVDIYDLELSEVMIADNMLGTTPLLTDLSPGMYYVVTSFPAELFAAEGVSLPGYSDPTYDNAFPFDGNLTSSVSFAGGEDVASIARVYRLNKQAGSSETLISIALPLAEADRGQALPDIYPTLATVSSLPAAYSLDSDVMVNAIDDNLREHGLTAQVSASLVDEMVEVLSRAGKVKLNTDSVDLIIQLGGYETSAFTITAYQ